MSAAIETHALTRRFGEHVAVDHVDLRVESGEIFGLLGPNGAGKTTLIRMVTGLQLPTSGEAFVAGVDVRRAPDAVRRAIGVVPQALTSDLELTGYENVEIYARFFDVPRDVRRARVPELLRRVGLWERRDDRVSTYSGGMRRRLEIARGLVHRPIVLFLDEPTIGLDPQSRRVIWELLRELRAEHRLTISLTTHSMDEAEELCDRVAIIDRGRIVALGAPAELEARMPGSDTLRIEVEGSLPESVRDRIRALAGVHSADLSGSTLEVRVDGGARLLPVVLAVIHDAGVSIAAASSSRITLEDVFIELTGRTLRDAHGTEAEARRAMMPRRYA